MTLYLLPTTLFEEQDKSHFLAQDVHDAVAQIDGLFAESERAGRRYLSHFKTKTSFREIPIVLVNEHTKREERLDMLRPLKNKQEVWGLVSDCGIPCIADPGEELVHEAYRMGIHVRGFSGPCSILLALMLSGLSAEKFSFRGYLSREQAMRKKEIKELDTRVAREHETMIIMEAPYRNRELFQDLIEVLSPECVVVVCTSLTLPSELVLRKTVAQWRLTTHEFQKEPTLFVIGLPR